MRAVTAEQKRQILQLAGDFPRLWAASTTTPRDRKRILRLLVRDITVTKGPEPKVVRLHVRWQGGEIETLQVQLPQKRADAIRYPTPFVERIRQLAVDHHDDEIVTLLRNEGHKSTTTGKPITPGTIKWLRYKHRIQAPQPPEGSLNVRQVRERYGVTSQSLFLRGFMVLTPNAREHGACARGGSVSVSQSRAGSSRFGALSLRANFGVSFLVALR
jgi:hypothetical protein